MSDDRIARALARIESAASRIETAAPLMQTPVQTPDHALSRKYEALRDETGRALAELDGLIGKFSR